MVLPNESLKYYDGSPTTQDFGIIWTFAHLDFLNSECSNHYLTAPGGVKRTGMTQGSQPWSVFVLKTESPKRVVALFFDDFSY